MTKKTLKKTSKASGIGVAVLSLLIVLLLFFGFTAIRASLSIPLEAGNQHELSIFGNLYTTLGLTAFVIVIPLLVLLVSQIALLRKK